MLPLKVNSVNSTWGEIYIPYNHKEYIFPYHIPSGEVFNHDDADLIRLKCAALVVLTPIVTLIRSICWVVKTLFLAIAAAFCYLDDNLTQQDKICLIQSFKDSGLAWYYGIQMTLYAALGIIFPYESRFNYGHLENSLNRHDGGPHRDKFYLAICFQRLIVYKDNNDAEVTQKLTNLLKRFQAIKAAIFSCSYQSLRRELKAARVAVE